MDNPSFAEIRKKFTENNIPIMKPRAPKAPHTIINETPIDSSIPERSEQSTSNILNQSSDDAYSVASDPAAASSQISSETSSSREAILARMVPPNTTSNTGFRKAPVPLPGISHDISNHPHFKKPSVPIPDSASRDSNENANLGSSSPISQSATNHSGSKKPPAPLPKPTNRNQNGSIPSQPSPSPSALHRVPPLGADTFPDPKKLSMPTPKLIESVQNENSDSEYASLSHNDTSHSTNVKQPNVFLSNPIDQDEYEIIHPQSLSISLDTVLPSQCTFFEFENLINGYQRKDPRAIIYPKTKATMPKITTNEINILQRYSNT